MKKTIIALVIIASLFGVMYSYLPVTGAYFERQSSLPGSIDVSIGESAHFFINLTGAGYGSGSGPQFQANVVDYTFSHNETQTFNFGSIFNRSSHPITNIRYFYSSEVLAPGDRPLGSLTSNKTPLVFSPSGNVSLAGGSTTNLNLTISVHRNHSTPGYYSGYVTLRMTINGRDYDCVFPLRILVQF